MVWPNYIKPGPGPGVQVEGFFIHWIIPWIIEQMLWYSRGKAQVQVQVQGSGGIT